MSDSRSRRRFRQVGTVVAVMACAGYYFTSRIVLDLFPFSSYSMFASAAAQQSDEVRACHLLAVGPDGRAIDVKSYRDWDCPPWQEAAQGSIRELGCGPHFNVEEHIRVYLAEHSGSDPHARPVQLVRRRWAFAQDQSVSIRDLPVASCKAVLR